MTNQSTGILEQIIKRSDIMLAVAVIAIIAVLIIPLPAGISQPVG